MSERCPFCDLSPERVVAQNSLAIALRARFPGAQGLETFLDRRPLK